MLKIHRPKCQNNDITTIRTSLDSHLHWKNHFHKNPLYFRLYADFEADNEKDNSFIGNKRNLLDKQNPVLNGYHTISELDDVLESECYESPLGYENVVWFMDEIIKLEKKGFLF